jgi:hypothetical protein
VHYRTFALHVKEKASSHRPKNNVALLDLAADTAVGRFPSLTTEKSVHSVPTKQLALRKNQSGKQQLQLG